MGFLLNRYRNVTVLLVTVFAQLLLIAYQVKSNSDVPLIKVWAVATVTPVERVLELARANTWGFLEDYFFLVRTRAENDRLRREAGQLKLENQYLRNELATADRARELSAFQAQSPSRMLAARVIGNAMGTNSKAVFIDRGSTSGVENGMAVVTPDGIAGKVVAAYPMASLVLLVTDANFAAGVISQKNHVRGTLKGQGHDGSVLVDYVQNEEKVDPGEWFYTSGDDRIFPKGFPAGQVRAVRNGRTTKQIYVAPSGFQGGLEEVLVVLEGAHVEIPESAVAKNQYKLTSPPPVAPDSSAEGGPDGTLNTDADKLKNLYQQVGEAEHHAFGEGTVGSPPPDFTKLPGLREGANQMAGRSKPAGPAATGAPNTLAGKLPQSQPSSAPGLPAGAAPASVQANNKPKRSAPLLVTDPADADPDDPSMLPPPARPRPSPPKPAP